MALPARKMVTARPRPVYYPTRDGKPIGETDKHRDLAFYTIAALKAHFAHRNVYVSGNNFIYWEEGNPKVRISPDAYVVFGVPMRQRDLYKAWEEGGHLPDVVFEFTSKKTRYEDTRKKLPLYEKTLRVREYFPFDPTGDYLKPRLQGYRLEDGEYRRLDLQDDRLYSRVLGLDLVMDGERMWLVEPSTGRRLLTYTEQAARAGVAECRALEEAQRAASEAERANAEAQRANAEAQRADAEARARAELEAEVARLRAELAARDRKHNGT